MRTTFAVAPIVGLMVSLSPAMAQEAATRPLTESIVREAARLGTETAVVPKDGPSQAVQSNSSRPAERVGRGTNIRVTAASVVDVPGVVRLVFPAYLQTAERDAGGRLLARDEESMTILRSDGKSVTIPRPRRQIAGAMESWDGQTLTIARGDGSVVTVPRSAIARLERFDGQSSRGESASRGFRLGAGTGLLTMGIISVPMCIQLKCEPARPIAFVAASTIVGGGLGALIGTLGGPRERWKRVDVSALDK